MYCILEGSELFVSLILFSILQVFSYLVTSFFLIQSFGMLIQIISVLTRAGKTDVTFVETNCLVFSSSSLK